MKISEIPSLILPVLFLILVSCEPKAEVVEESTPTTEKPRTIVTTDGEIDDVDSFIRMLLYANEFQIEGLIYSSSMWHYKGDGKGTSFTSEMEMTKNIYGAQTDLRWPGVEWMNPLLDAYEEVFPKLSQHAEGFPTADHLRSLIRVGNIDFEGEMEVDTEGSDFIKAKLLDEDMEPIYLQVWGGTNTIARALKSIEDEYKTTPEWDAVYKKVVDKTILYAILDQDATYRKYIAPNWPDLKIFYNSSQFWCFAYDWKRAVPESQHELFEGKFMGNEIINNHGPLLKQYYSYGDGQKQEGDDEHIHGDPTKLENAQWGTFGVYDFISEGDSPAYLHLIDVGLNNLNHPEWGGWGGRLVQSDSLPNRWEDGQNVLDYNPFTEKLDATYPQIRWVEAIQKDFAARADWCVMDYAEANHAPIVKALGANHINAKPGESFTLQVETSDPDGDKLETKFWIYKEVGTYQGEADLNLNGNQVTFSLDDSSLGQLHIIAEVKDDAVHPMTRYQRFVVEVK